MQQVRSASPYSLKADASGATSTIPQRFGGCLEAI